MIDLLTFIDGGKVGGVKLPPLHLPGRDPIRLSKRQRQIIREATATDRAGLPKYKQVALCWPKGGGKSLLAAAELARRFVTVEHSRSVILGPSERQVSSVVAHTLRDLLRGTYPGFEVGKQVIENPALGSSVVIVPASEGSVQGVRPHRGVVVVDEAHEFPSDPQDRADSEVGGAFNLLLSQSEDPGSQVWLLGMVGTSEGYLYLLKGLFDSGHVPHVYFSFETDPLTLNPTLTREFLEQRRAEMLPMLYRVHFENAVAESVEGAFDPAWIEAAKARGAAESLTGEGWVPGDRPNAQVMGRLPFAVPMRPEVWQALREREGSMSLGIGLDRAMSLTAAHDKTALCVLAKSPRRRGGIAAPVWLLRLHVFAVGHTADDIRRVLEEVRKDYQTGWLTADAYQCLDLARSVAGHKADLVHEGLVVQTQGFGTVGQWLRDGRFVFPPGEGTDYLCRELVRLRMKATRALDAARFEGKPHDDSAHALALACRSLTQFREFDVRSA